MSMRKVDARVDVYRNGAKFLELSSVSAPTVQMSYDSEIKSSMSGQFIPNEDVNWLSDSLVPIAIIDDVEYRLGEFFPATISTTRNNGFVSLDVEAYDGCWIAQCKRSESVLNIASGTNYITAIETLLYEAGITKLIKTNTTNTITEDREDWEIGTDYLTIINQLLDEINFNQLWFNKDGYAVLEPNSIRDISNVKRTYDYYTDTSMMIDDTSIVLDLFDSPNVFLCICDNPDKSSVLTAKVENNNPASPFSIINRGRRIMSVTSVNNIASQTELNEYAEILCNESMFKGKEMSLSTLIRTDMGCRDIVAINHPDYSGICIETEWSISLATGGTVTHTLQTQPIAIMKESPKSNGAIAGIAIAGISIVGTS